MNLADLEAGIAKAKAEVLELHYSHAQISHGRRGGGGAGGGVNYEAMRKEAGFPKGSQSFTPVTPALGKMTNKQLKTHANKLDRERNKGSASTRRRRTVKRGEAGLERSRRRIHEHHRVRIAREGK